MHPAPEVTRAENGTTTECGGDTQKEKVKHMRHRKTKTVWAYLDGKKLVDVVQAALDNNMMVDDLKRILIEENPGHIITFKVQ